LDQAGIRYFRKLCAVTVAAVYVLILAGSIVRTTSSGMGCPDWPRCFGKWIPPTTAEQLPQNYKQVNAEFRAKKNERFIRYLKIFGFNETASRLEQDKSVLREEDFNSTKAWIEYFNRLVGVAVGGLILWLFWKSIHLRKVHPFIFKLSALALGLVIFQGWFGSIVVSTNLTPWTISIHLFLALLIIALLVTMMKASSEVTHETASWRVWLVLLCMSALLTQMYYGTNVRGAVDGLMGAAVPRQDWVFHLGMPFFVHRSFSWLVLITHVMLVLTWPKTSPNSALPRGLIILILIALLAGIGMAYGDIPVWLQPLHLLIASLAFGVQWYLLLLIIPGGKKIYQ
jgi:heme a synthase